jgi:hypothetical protein
MIILYRDYKTFLGSSSVQPRDRRVKKQENVRLQVEAAIHKIRSVYSDITGGYVSDGLVFFGYTINRDGSIRYSFSQTQFQTHQSNASK